MSAFLSSPNPCRFSRRHYRQTLLDYLEAGYVFTDFGALDSLRAPSSEKQIIMRHDIDFDPSLMSNLTDIESEVGVGSTTFFRTESSAYSVAHARQNFMAAKKTNPLISAGLHYDLVDGDNLAGFVAVQLQKISGEFDDEVTGGSAHDPARHGGIPSGDIVRKGGLKWEAFEATSKHGFKYISDSSRRWREGCFCQWIGRADRLHVLTHPIWWQPGSAMRKQSLIDSL